jgi:signal transduction histidine kinase
MRAAGSRLDERVSGRGAGTESQVRRHAARLLRERANDGEMIIAVARMILSAALLVRYLILEGPGHGDPATRVVRRVVGSCLVIGLSALLVRRARAQALGRAAHTLCSVWDALVCFFALRANILWAGSGYDGILRMPDVAFLSVLVFGSALRLHWEAVVASLVLNAGSLAVLVGLDRATNGPTIVAVKDVEIVCMQLAVAAAAALVCVWATGRLVRHLAREGERVTRGRRYLDEMLREHHDLRTLLSTASLQLGLVKRDRGAFDVVDRLDVIERAVGGIAAIVSDIKSRTFGELAVTAELSEASLEAILDSAVGLARDRFATVAIQTECRTAIPRVRIFGGDRALTHVLVNVLVNACEGDGDRRPSRVQVRATSVAPAARVLIEISDDGPGFLPQLLEIPWRGGLTTKRDGTGLGLTLISDLVNASGGTICLQNPPEGGARVVLSLPSCT